jgi:RNA polymerase sigma-70 factor (ECF subfamily)
MSTSSDLKNAREMEASFLKIIDEHQRMINKLCRAYCNTRVDEKDLYQEIMYQLWKAYPDYRGDSKIGTWVYSVALRSAILPYRRIHRNPIEFPETLPDHPSGEAAMDEGPDDQLHNLLHRLGDFGRTALTLMMEGFSNKEIGTVLGLKEKTVGQRMNRVRKAINND